MEWAKDFWSRASVGDPEECWEWQAGHTGKGYGAFWLEGKTCVAHRLAYVLTHGPVPCGLVVRHRCDNPPCVNPGHLLVGTHGDNAQDRKLRNRAPVGSAHHMTPLSATDVRAIRTDHVMGAVPADLAARYGISSTAIIAILKGRSWQSVTSGVSVHRNHARLRSARRAAAVRQYRPHLTQQAVAEMLGISQAAVSYLERQA